LQIYIQKYPENSQIGGIGVQTEEKRNPHHGGASHPNASPKAFGMVE
jgi:hypothetical protein